MVASTCDYRKALTKKKKFKKVLITAAKSFRMHQVDIYTEAVPEFELCASSKYCRRCLKDMQL